VTVSILAVIEVRADYAHSIPAESMQ